MTEDKLSWLRGPLPPLSEAMKSSGILANVNVPQISPEQQHFYPKIEEKTEKIPKKKSKILSPKEQKPIQPQVRSKSKMVQFTTVNPDNFANYRPPPIESQIGGSNKQVQFFEPPPIAKEKSSVKEEIARLNGSLDETIRSLLPTGPLNDEEKFEFTMQLVRVHNYTMNQLILLDKQSCSDRALLLRRLSTFYQEVIEDFPSYFSSYKERIATLEQQVSSLSQSLGIFKEKADSCEAKMKKQEEEIEVLKDEKEQLTKRANDGDVDKQTLEEKNQMLENVVYNLKFKLKKEDEEKEKLKQFLESTEEENKKQIDTIEKLSQQLKEKANGESGVVWDLRKAEVRINELEEKNTKLNRSIYLLEHKELFDACVDTSDLPQDAKSKKKRKASIQNVAGDQNPYAQTGIVPQVSMPGGISKTPSMSKFNFIPSEKSFASIPTTSSLNLFSGAPSQTNLKVNECGMKRIVSLKEEEVQTDTIEKTTIEVQTDAVEFANPAQNDKQENTEENNDKDAQNQAATKPVELTEEELDSNFNIEDVVFDDVPGYTLDKEKIASIPQLFSTLVPFLGTSYKNAITTELDRLNIGKITGVKKQDRSLVWALQIIHNFLCDPYIRSYEASQFDNCEKIFVEWLLRVYKLQHLVNQMCADISIKIFTMRDEEDMIRFFSDIMENKFSYTQLCFISLIYTFAVQFSNPLLTDLLQDPDLPMGHPKIMIHVKAAYYLLARTMSPILASGFMRSKIDPSVPMWGFIDFLRKAAQFFTDKHKQISTRSSDILFLCGQVQGSNTISYDAFNKFMCLLDSVEDHKHWYEAILSEKRTSALDLSQLISVCAERKRPLLELLRLDKVSACVEEFKKYKALAQEFYWHFLKRYTITITAVLEKLPASIIAKVQPIISKIRVDLLNVDFHALLWHYRLFLSIIDKDMLDIVQEIPFQLDSSDKVYEDVINFFDMTEKISFSLIVN